MMAEAANGGRITEQLADTIAEGITQGQWPVDSLAPSIRRLAGDFGVSTKTAHRALNNLAMQGILQAESRRGYRIAKKPDTSRIRDQNLAYVLEPHAGPPEGDAFHRLLSGSLQTAALTRRWPMLSMHKAATPPEMVGILRANRVFGTVLDLARPDAFVRTLRKANIPSVLIDCGTENAEADMLIQDGHAGGKLAVEHLVACGCRRIAWVGNTRASAHSMDRLGGALLGMHCAGLGGFTPDMLLDLDPLHPNHIPDPAPVKTRIRKLLTGSRCPDGILALWTPYAHWVHEMAVESGLQIGRDLQIVGWSVEEMYDNTYVPGFGKSTPPPAIVWKAETMVETAIARLAERRTSPDLSVLKIKIPVRLST